METFKKINFRSPFLWAICGLPILFFGLNWFFLFRLFPSNLSEGLFFFLFSLLAGGVLLLSLIFLEKETKFSGIVFVLGNLLPWAIFSLFSRASFLSLIILAGLALLFFFKGRKIFRKETANQIKIQPVVSLKKPFKGLLFSLAILFASGFYFVNFFQEEYSVEPKSGDDKIFGSALKNMASVWDKIFPGGGAMEKFNLNLTIDEYIRQNLPPQDQSLMGQQVQLPDGTLTIYNQALVDELEKISIENAREQLSRQFERQLNGNEKLFQVIGMILDQKTEGFLVSLNQIWPNLSPLLFIKAASFFLAFIWLGGLLSWPAGKIAEGLLWLFFKKGLIKKETRQVEKEEFSFE